MSSPTNRPHLLNQVSFFDINSPLLAYQKKVTSQFGEDGIIERIFELIKTTNKYCLEFGAWDGKYLSNCWDLITNKQWRGCFVEADRRKFAELLQTYSGNDRVNCLNRFVEFEGENSLDRILSEVGAPKDLDFASIDVDGIDYFIWDSLKEYRPRALVIEFNPSIPNDVVFVQEKSINVNHGCSLLSLVMLGKEKGYELVCAFECNAFFVQKELYDSLGIPSNFIHLMYRPTCDGRIFHGYDSQIFMTGMPRLIWRNIPLDSSDFQVVPASMRRYGDINQG